MSLISTFLPLAVEHCTAVNFFTTHTHTYIHTHTHLHTHTPCSMYLEFMKKLMFCLKSCLHRDTEGGVEL